MSFADTAPVQPVGRNGNRIKILMIGVCGVVVLGIGAKRLWESTSHTPVAEPKFSAYEAPARTDRAFPTGYAREPVPAPEAPPAPAPALAPVTIINQPATIVNPEPPKPLSSGAIGAMVAAIDGGGRHGNATAGAGRSSGGAAGSRPGMDDGRSSLDEDNVQGLSAWKNRWYANAGTGGDDFVTAPFSPPISDMMIQAGTIIPAVTLTAVNTDLPGDVVSMVSSPVCDTPTGENLLIPAGSKLYGRYADQLAFGQSRAQIAWVRILFPDGSSQNIGSMSGTDAQGGSGVEADVNTHPWGMAGAIGGAALFSIIGQAGSFANAAQGGSGGDPTINVIGAGAGGAGNAAQSIGSKMVNKQLNRPRTLTIEPGSSLNLLVSKDIALPNYEDRGCGE